MITEENKKRTMSAKIPDDQVEIIKAFIQGAIYTFCKNNKDEDGKPAWFSARDLFGGENYEWAGTPINQIYEWHANNKANDPVNMAGCDVGHILKTVIDNDRRVFNTREGYTREYQYTTEGKS